MKRKKVNWLQNIEEAGLSADFEKFASDNTLKQHLKGKKELSRNRLACAYIRHVNHVLKTRWL